MKLPKLQVRGQKNDFGRKPLTERDKQVHKPFYKGEV